MHIICIYQVLYSLGQGYGLTNRPQPNGIDSPGRPGVMIVFPLPALPG